MSDATWKQLVVTVDSLEGQGELAKAFWPSAINALEREGIPMTLPKLDDEALFHVRLTSNNTPVNYIELLRLKTTAGQSSLLKAVQDALPSGLNMTITEEFWQSIPLSQSNRFFTFLQACSILRTKHNIVYPRFLSGPEQSHEAYHVMREPDRAWTTALLPWFNHLDTMSTNPTYSNEKPDDYGHWFGHILSDRFS